MSNKFLIAVAVLILALSNSAQANLQESRKTLILQALNSKPENWIAPIPPEAVEMGEYEGRIVVNQKSKFTYYLHIENSKDLNSKMILVPMSTSRYTPTYYQSDDWWEANKDKIAQAKAEGKPMPKQDMEEVKVWLEQMKFSTNPDVFVIQPGSSSMVRTVKLQTYLTEIYLQNFIENGRIVLYRGAEKPGELESWLRGEVPRGVRYWTPTANYAWRYGRKNREFLDLLLQDKAPLFRFEVPVEDFKAMIFRRWPRLVLGTELTKNAHQIFDRSRYFGDHLYDSLPFLGWGKMAIELEVRSNRNGARQMVQYFKRAVTIQDLVQDRVRVLQSALDRLKIQVPGKAEMYETKFKSRIEQTLIEGEILQALKDGKPESEIQRLLAKAPSRKTEIAYIDGTDLRSWALKKASQNKVRSCSEVMK